MRQEAAAGAPQSGTSHISGSFAVDVDPRRSAAPGTLRRSGLRFEHAKVVLDNASGSDLLYSVAQDLARADLPEEAQRVLRTGSLVAYRA